MAGSSRGARTFSPIGRVFRCVLEWFRSYFGKATILAGKVSSILAWGLMGTYISKTCRRSFFSGEAKVAFSAQLPCTRKLPLGAAEALSVMNIPPLPHASQLSVRACAQRSDEECT